MLRSVYSHISLTDMAGTVERWACPAGTALDVEGETSKGVIRRFILVCICENQGLQGSRSLCSTVKQCPALSTFISTTLHTSSAHTPSIGAPNSGFTKPLQ